MNAQEERSVQFSAEDFRTWNETGFEEVTAALGEARKRFAEAHSLREKELAQLRLESLEQLYRLALQVARERFERARTDAAGRLRVVVEKLQSTVLPVATADQLWQRVSNATHAFADKKFGQVISELRSVEAQIAPKPLRRPPSPRSLVGSKPAATLVKRKLSTNNDLLVQATQHEQGGRCGAACRLYLKALVQSVTTDI